VDEECDVDMEEMLRHIEPEVLLGSAKGLENFETLKKASKDRMYEGCGKEWTVLRFMLHLLVVKEKFGWLDNSFNELLTLLASLLPKPNLVPRNTYEAKKIINPLKMQVQRIHACRNHCILYRSDYTELEKCQNCDANRYKSNADFAVERVIASKGTKRKVGGKKSVFSQVEEEYSIGTDTATQRKVPTLVMWYLPVEDRLKRLFSNPKTTELITWHADRPEKSNGKLRHPFDAQQWRTFDSKHKKFREEKRNIRFTLSTDSMNPFGERSSTHSTWPVLMTIYNLPLAMSPEKVPFAYHSNPRTEAT
jgi:hypothetical protein